MADEVAGAYVTITPDLGGFEADLDSKLRGAMAGASATVTVDADTAEARAKLDGIQGSLDRWSMEHGAATADVDTGQGRAKLDELKASLDEFGRKRETASAEVNTSGAAGGMSTLLGLVGALGPVAAAAVGVAAGALAALPAMLGGAALGAGALVLGFKGVGTALQAMNQAQVTSAQTAAQAGLQRLADAQAEQSAARQVATAEQQLAAARHQQATDQITSAESVKAAEQGLADARIAAAQSVAAAEQNLQSAEAGLTQAVYTEQQAQQALIQARQTAQEQLESYQRQVADGALQQRQDILNVQQAKENLDKVLANPQATELQRQQAQLAYDQAVQQQQDQAETYADLKEQAAAAAKAGVDGATNVVNAQHQLGQATQGVADAEQKIGQARAALADAQRKAAESVGNAEQKVADARRQQADQAAADAQRIAQAQQAVVTAQQQVADVQARVALQAQNASVGNAALAQAMANLSPAGQAFVTWFHGSFEPVLKQLQASDQQALLPGIQAAMTTLLPVLADIQPFLIEAATGIAQWAQALATWLSGPQGMGDLNSILGAGVQFMQDLGKAALSVIQGIGNLGAQATPIVSALGGWIERVAQSFQHWTVDGGSAKFIEWLQQNGPKLGELLGTIARTVGDWGKAAAGLAPVELDILNAVAPLLDAIVKANPTFTAFVTTFGGLAVVAGKLAGPIKTVGGVITGGMDFVKAVSGAKQLEGIMGKLAGGVRSMGIAMGILSAAEDVEAGSTEAATGAFIALDAVPVVALIVGIIAAIAALVFGIYELVTHWREVWDTIKQIASDVWGWMQDAWNALWGGIVTVATTIWDFIKGHWQELLLIFGPVGIFADTVLFLFTHWSDIWGAIQTVAQTVWGAISGFFSTAWDAFKTAADTVWQAIRDVIIAPITWLWDLASGAFAVAWHGIRTFFENEWNGWKTIVSAIWGAIVGGVIGAWNAVFDLTKGILVGAWHGIRTFFENEWNGWVSIISGIWGLIGGAITGVWDGIKTAAGTLWDDIEGIFVGGVNVVIDILNFFIGVIDDVLGFFHLPTIDKLAHWTAGTGHAGESGNAPVRIPAGGGKAFAAGGQVGPGGSDTVPAWLTPGEFVVRADVVDALGADFFHQLNAGGFQFGGLVGDITGAAKAVGGAISGAASAVGGAVSGIARKAASELAQGVLDVAEAPLGAMVAAMPAGFFHDTAQGVVHTIHDAVASLIEGHRATEGGANVPGSALPSGAHLDIIRRALLAAGKPDTPPNEGALNIIVTGESGWVPDVVNRWDSNWAAGTPSVGLGQVIGPTFREYAGAYVDTQPQLYGVSIDPVANLVAATEYAYSRYGGLTNVPGVRSVSSGGAYQGYDGGGWLPSGGVVPVNQTGRPEAVLTPDESAAFQDLARRAGGSDDLIAEMRAMRESHDRLVAAFERQTDRQLLLARTGARGR